MHKSVFSRVSSCKIFNGLHDCTISSPHVHGPFTPSYLCKCPLLIFSFLVSRYRVNPLNAEACCFNPSRHWMHPSSPRRYWMHPSNPKGYRSNPLHSTRFLLHPEGRLFNPSDPRRYWLNPSHPHLNWVQIALYHPLSHQEDVASYSSLLRSCSSPSALPQGMHLHHHILRDALELHPFIENLLLHLYCKCGALEEACSLFTRHSERDVFSWDFLIRACIQYRDTRRALDLFDQMQHEAFLPDKVIYSSALIACSTDPDSFCTGQKLHARIVASPFISDIVLRTALVSLYNKCGNVDHAQQLFHGISEHDEVSCNAMIEAYVGHGHGGEALNVYEKMQWEGLMANASTFVSLLSLCVNTSKLTLGKVIHVEVLENGVEADVRVATALVSMYGRCGGLEHAQKLFATSGERDVVMWNALLAAYAQNGHSHDALVVYEQMQQEGFLPERVTFVSVLQACSTESMFVQGQQVHACIKSWGHDLDLVVGNALVTMYSSRGKIEYAQSVFEKLPEKDVVSWTAMITARAQQGHAKGAWQFLYRMHQEGIMPNEVTLVSVISAYASLADPIECRHFHTWLVANDYACVGDVGNALISMYAKSGCLKDAQDLFSQLAEKDSISWNALISACAQNAHGEDALRLYEQMHMEGVLADSAAFASVLAACAEHADLLKGQQMHVQILNIELDLDDAVWNSILNMYGKCGVIMKAYSMFNEMASRNLISWNSMIAGCAQHGEGKHALGLLLKMVQTGVQPDSTTFMSVLTACSHSGLLNEGLCMIIMIRCLERVVTLDHLNCFIDALGRLGRIADAWDLMVRMPFQPTRASHIGLLNACRHHVDVKLGQAATKQALELVPEDTALPVLMSNLYGMAGAEEFTGMQETCVMSNCGPGC